MAFYYHKAHSLNLLFPELYRLIKEERKTLKPQTPQTVIVGSLDIEAYIQEEFIVRDGVLMGVHFPFLEAALETFAERRKNHVSPGAHESWFSPIPGEARTKTAGLLHVELSVLNLLLAARAGNTSIAFEYDIQNLGSLQLLTVAQRIAREIREYLLHAPEAMENFLRVKPTGLTGKIWKTVNAELRSAGYNSGMFACTGAGETGVTAKEPSLFDNAGGGALYLFGMPMLSAYHIRKLCSAACSVDVHLMGFHPEATGAVGNDYFLQVAKKHAAYAAFIRKTAADFGAEIFETSHAANLAPWQTFWLGGDGQANEAKSPVQFIGLPGLWRGAEIIADLWHEAMRDDHALRQYDFSLMLTDPAAQFAAFDRACGMRRLSVFARNRLFERPSGVVELVAILGTAAGDGVNRDLLVRYFSNAVVRDKFGLDNEKTNLYIRALTEASGFRNDYPGALGIFNLAAALGRIRHAILIDPATAIGEEIPGTAYIRRFDTAETLDEFISCLEILTGVPVILKPQPAADLVRQLTNTLGKFQDEPSLEFNAIVEVLADIAALLPGQQLTLQQIARLLQKNIPGKNLAQSAQRQGICASAFSAPAPFRRWATLCDMSEDLDAMPENEEKMLAEYLRSPTRLKKDEQIAIHLVQSALSPAEVLQICYSRFDPETGAEKYRSVEVERFKASLVARGINFSESENFPQTIFDRPDDSAAIAADDDVRTVKLSYAKPAEDLTLPRILLPPLPETAAEFTVRNLIAYVQAPFDYFYRRITAPPEDPADFRYGEPKLAETKTLKFRFVENYLRDSILAPDDTPLANPLALLAAEQRRGLGEPEGFDFMRRLLAAGENERILAEAAHAARLEFRLVEYVCDARIKTPFSVRDGARLVRRYLPAPSLGSVVITGTSDKFLVRGDDTSLYALSSFKDADRTKNCIRIYLQLALILAATHNFADQAPAGINLLQYKAEPGGEAGELEISSGIKFALSAEKLTGGEAYLQEIALAISARRAPYFAVDLLGTNKLGGFAAKSDADLLAALGKTAENSDRRDFLTDFYKPDLDEESVAFFNEFIRPIALADAATPKPKVSKKK